jgi:small subunit ribosomal protein S21
MLEVRVKEGESIDDALRRFKRLCGEDTAELKKRRYYEKPSDIRRKRKTRRKGKEIQNSMERSGKSE